MKKIFALLVLLSMAAMAETQVVEWSLSPNRVPCYAVKIKGKDVKMVGMEWAEFVKKYEYCYVKRWYGWAKVKTAKMDETDWDWPSGGVVVIPTHIPPYRNDGSSGLVIITPTISGEPHKK